MGGANFYYELGVQLFNVCLGLRNRTGGVLELTEALKWVNKLRGSNPVSVEDLRKAIDTLSVLGKGLSVLRPAGGSEFIMSVPIELDNDPQELISRGKETGFVDKNSVPGWAPQRFQKAVVRLTQEALVAEGIVWVDEAEGQTTYFFPSKLARE